METQKTQSPTSTALTTSKAVLDLTNKRISDTQGLQAFIAEASKVAIVLFPETITPAAPGLKLGAALVKVNTALDSYGNNRDIYKNESGGFCLHLSKLNEIAQQAGLQITDSRVMERKTDEQGRVVYISHQVSWRIKSIDGSVKEGVATGKYDYFNDLATKKEGQVKSRRKHAEALAESNALTRAYNKAIAQLPSGFTIEELRKPFLVPFVLQDNNELLSDLDPETQKQLKTELARKRLGLVNEIYPENGNGNGKKVEDAEYTEVNQQPTPPVEQVNEDSEPSDPAAGLSKDEAEINAETFRGAPEKERLAFILVLSKRKAYQAKDGKAITEAAIKAVPLDRQIKWIEAMLQMPDKAEELPF